MNYFDELVKERTGQLQTANEQLERELAQCKQADETLEASTQQWQATFDAIGDAISLMDPQGRILRCNMAMTHLLGKPFNEIIGQTCWELVHGTSQPIEGCPIMRMWETCHRETLVMPIGDRWFEVTADPVLDEAGNFIGAIHIMADITERKRAEEELKRSREELRKLATHLQLVREEERAVIAWELHNDTTQALSALGMDIFWLRERLPRDQQSLLDKTKAMSELLRLILEGLRKLYMELRPAMLDELGLAATIEWQAEKFERLTGTTKEMIEGYLAEHPDATWEQIGTLLGVSQQRAYQLLKLLGIRTSRQLTERELKILRCIASGNGNRQIAEALNLSEQTIKNETTVILAKLKANNRAHAVILATKQGLI